jgi:hypothetical protein
MFLPGHGLVRVTDSWDPPACPRFGGRLIFDLTHPGGGTLAESEKVDGID